MGTYCLSKLSWFYHRDKIHPKRNDEIYIFFFTAFKTYRNSCEKLFDDKGKIAENFGLVIAASAFSFADVTWTKLFFPSIKAREKIKEESVGIFHRLQRILCFFFVVSFNHTTRLQVVILNIFVTEYIVFLSLTMDNINLIEKFVVSTLRYF